MKYIICDLDGVIFDDTHRSPLAKAKKWDEYFDAMKDDTYLLHNIEIVKHLAEQRGLVFCTGRPERYEMVTSKMLDKYFNHYGLHMRPEADFSSNATLKERMVRSLGADNVEYGIDDNIKCIQMYMSHNVLPVCLFRGVSY